MQCNKKEQWQEGIKSNLPFTLKRIFDVSTQCPSCHFSVSKFKSGLGNEWVRIQAHGIIKGYGWFVPQLGVEKGWILLNKFLREIVFPSLSPPSASITGFEHFPNISLSLSLFPHPLLFSPSCFGFHSLGNCLSWEISLSTHCQSVLSICCDKSSFIMSHTPYDSWWQRREAERTSSESVQKQNNSNEILSTAYLFLSILSRTFFILEFALRTLLGVTHLDSDWLPANFN